MRRFMVIVVPALVLTGCDLLSGASDPDPVATNTASVPPSPRDTPGAGATQPVGGARQFVDETDTYLFEYAYPQVAGDTPGLAAWLDRRLESQREALARQAARGREQARSNGFPFNKYSSSVAWEVVADLPRWLSLSADLDSYEGGAHPNYGFDALLWDRERERAVEPIALFTSAEALDAALGGRLCEALNAERERRRGAPVAPSDDSFEACVKPDETNLLLGSTGGEHFDRIGIQIAPYIAGPYAEGSYEFSFDMDEELLAIVKPEYRAAFGAEN